MTFDWKALAARIDDMSLRERAMLFASAGLVLLVFAHVALLDPVLRKQKALIDRVTRDQSQINAVRAQIEQIVKTGDDQVRHPEQQAIESLQREIEQADRAMAEKQKELIAPERLPGLLQEILGRSEGVRLEALRILPGVPLRSSAGEAKLYRHGVEITLMGSFFDLLRYVEAIERRSAALLWGAVELQAERYPEVGLRIVIHTLSPNASLLAI